MITYSETAGTYSETAGELIAVVIPTAAEKMDG